MFNYKITCDKGYSTMLCARTRGTAVRLYCISEGCTEEWFWAHCKIRKILFTNKKFKLTEMRMKVHGKF